MKGSPAGIIEAVFSNVWTAEVWAVWSSGHLGFFQGTDSTYRRRPLGIERGPGFRRAPVSPRESISDYLIPGTSTNDLRQAPPYLLCTQSYQDRCGDNNAGQNSGYELRKECRY